MPDAHPATHSICIVRCGTDIFEQVIALHGPNRGTLGFFPRGAFEEYARKDGILVAVSDDGRVLGYIAVRTSGGWAHIAHLCVDGRWRRSSIAKELVERISANAAKHQHLGVRLKCRRDFEANHFWPKVGFVARGQKPGRGAEPRDLTVWIRRNAEVPDLFSFAGSDDPDRRLVVLDANTFYDLQHEDDMSNNLPERVKESLQLCAGWLQDAVELCVVDEIYCEIERRSCSDEVKLQRERVAGFRELSHNGESAKEHYTSLQAILGWHRPKTQQRSDMWQIAKAAAAGADFFVTRDETLLKAASRISEELSILILRPSALLTSIDGEGRSELYSPSRLAGTNTSVRIPTDDGIKQVLDAFLGRNPQEPLHRFRSLVQRILAEAAGRQDRLVQLMSDENNAPVVMVAYRFATSGDIDIEILRSAAHRLAPTAIRHVLLTVIQEAANHGGRRIVLTDPHCSNLTKTALEELHFAHHEGRWYRELRPEVVQLASLGSSLGIAEPEAGWVMNDILGLEDRFWPLKIQGMDVPCVVVTINDHWAAKLFDSELAMSELFAVDPLRVLNRENVFYRHKDKWPKSEPKRILWYVSRTNTFRACSRLLNVERGPAFKLFRRYERLGVYEWDDLIRTTDGNPHGELMAIHFTDTELFDRPVSLDFAKTLGVGKMVAGPQPVSEQQFLQIYTAGLTRFSSK